MSLTDFPNQLLPYASTLVCFPNICPRPCSFSVIHRRSPRTNFPSENSACRPFQEGSQDLSLIHSSPGVRIVGHLCHGCATCSCRAARLLNASCGVSLLSLCRSSYLSVRHDICIHWQGGKEQHSSMTRACVGDGEVANRSSQKWSPISNQAPAINKHSLLNLTPRTQPQANI